ncbi:hypothetical protein CsatB_006241 [Cannabis sativa]
MITITETTATIMDGEQINKLMKLEENEVDRTKECEIRFAKIFNLQDGQNLFDVMLWRIIKDSMKLEDDEVKRLKKSESQCAEMFKIVMIVEGFLFTLMNFKSFTIECRYELVNVIIQYTINCLSLVNIIGILGEIQSASIV